MNTSLLKDSPASYSMGSGYHFFERQFQEFDDIYTTHPSTKKQNHHHHIRNHNLIELYQIFTYLNLFDFYRIEYSLQLRIEALRKMSILNLSPTQQSQLLTPILQNAYKPEFDILDLSQINARDISIVFEFSKPKFMQILFRVIKGMFPGVCQDLKFIHFIQKQQFHQ
jgi:hypothetical protein